MGWLGDTLGGVWEGIGNAAESGTLLAGGKQLVDLYTQKRQVDKMQRQAARQVVKAQAGAWQGPVMPGQIHNPTGGAPLTIQQAGPGALMPWAASAVQTGAEYLIDYLTDPAEAEQSTELAPYMGGQTMAPRPRAPIPGGIYMGEGGGMYRTTAKGNRVPNKITLIKDEMSNQLRFFAHAGAPTGFSKVSFKSGAKRKHTHKRTTHSHSKKHTAHGRKTKRGGGHTNARARALLKAVNANPTMSPASKSKARATIKRNHPSLR